MSNTGTGLVPVTRLIDATRKASEKARKQTEKRAEKQLVQALETANRVRTQDVNTARADSASARETADAARADIAIATATREAENAISAARAACDVNVDIAVVINNTADASAAAAIAVNASERAIAEDGTRNAVASAAAVSAVEASFRATTCATNLANNIRATSNRNATDARNAITRANEIQGEFVLAEQLANDSNTNLRTAAAAQIATLDKNKNYRNVLLIAVVIALICTITLIVVGLTNREHFDNYFWWFIGAGIFLFLVIIIMIIMYFRNTDTDTVNSVTGGIATGGTYIGGKFVTGAGFTIGNNAKEFGLIFKVFFGGIASLLIGGGIALLFTGIRNNTEEFNTAAIGCLVGGVFTLLTILFAFNTEVIQKNFTQIILIHLVLIAAIVFTLLGFTDDSTVNTQGQSKTLWGFTGTGIGLFVIFLIGFITFYYLNRGNNFKSIFIQNFYNIFVIFLLAAAFTAGVSMLIITLTTNDNEHLAIPSAILLILGSMGAIVAKKYVKFSK